MTDLLPEADPGPLSVISSRISHRFIHDGQLTHEIAVDGAVHRSSVRVPEIETPDDLSGDWWKAYLRGAVPASEPRGLVRSVELFCGPGGLALGLNQACRELGLEMRSVGAVDQDAEAVTVYRRHNATRTTSTASVSTLVDYRVRGIGTTCRFQYEPEVLNQAFVDLVGHVDVVLAGPPCQGHSNLNNKTRRTDKRNELYLTAPAIGIGLGAPVIIIENVQAAIHDRKQVVQSTMALLEHAGYHISSGVLRAGELGWPQRRDRFFLIARLDRAPLPVEEMMSAFRHPEPRNIWWALDELEDATEDDFMNQRPNLSEENVRRIDWLFDNDKFDLDLSERPDCHKDGTTYNAVYGRLHKDKPAPTITTGFMTPGRGRYIHPTRRRVLTPREAARLQGFPDTYDFRLSGGEVPPKSKLGKWIGDAVPMPLGYIAALAALGPGWA